MMKNSSMQVIPPAQRSSRMQIQSAAASGAEGTEPTAMMHGDNAVAVQSNGNQAVSFAVTSSMAGSARDDLKSGPSRSTHQKSLQEVSVEVNLK